MRPSGFAPGPQSRVIRGFLPTSKNPLSDSAIAWHCMGVVGVAAAKEQQPSFLTAGIFSKQFIMNDT
jgi:hypothetical protein